MDHLKLAENIANHRKRCRVTQEELADFVGVTKASVSKWENGATMPDIGVLPQLAVFFDISGYIAQKREALNQYGIEHQRFGAENDTLFANNIGRNKLWGYSNGVQYAEGFLPFKLLF